MSLVGGERMSLQLAEAALGNEAVLALLIELQGLEADVPIYFDEQTVHVISGAMKVIASLGGSGASQP